MLIGELARRSGFSKDTIRYYEKIGLIVLAARRRTVSNSYRDYPEDTLHTLAAIRKYKQLGFTLEEIRELLVLCSVQVLDISKMLQIVELKIAGVNAELEKMHESKLLLNREYQLLQQKKTGHLLTLPEMKMAA